MRNSLTLASSILATCAQALAYNFSARVNGLAQLPTEDRDTNNNDNNFLIHNYS